MDKIITIKQAVAKIQDGASIMLGGFLGVGAPLRCIQELVERGVKNLTIISAVNGYPGGGFDMAPLFSNKQVKKFIGAHLGTCPEAVEAYKNGEIEVEYYPMGTWIEKIRAAGAGLGGVLTPIGLGTLVEQGKQKMTIAGKEYLLELPLKADFALLKGYRADKMGNVEYRGVAVSSNPTIAMAAKYTIAEVDEIVEIGEIEPIRVGTPGIFVDAVVQGSTFAGHQKELEELWVRTGRLQAN
jgi:acetate CoA/acetoacetate CoA-transferase alpha subunit